jgi:ribonucleoside-diphosphate reductase beta chain
LTLGTVADQEDLEPRDALDSFARWERQQWTLFNLDLGADRLAWEALPGLVAEQLRVGIDRFFLGELAVTETLTPLAHAAPSPEERFFLCAQLADEARHTLFFLRYLEAVGDEASINERWAAAPDHFSELLDEELRTVTDAAGGDPAAWYRAVTLYHLVVEGVLAVSGQRSLLEWSGRFSGLAMLRDGLHNVARDESRHIRFGVGALKIGAASGYGEAIAEQLLLSLDNAVRVVVRPEYAFPVLLPGKVRAEVVQTAERQLRLVRGALLGRVQRIGLDDSRVAAIAAAWDDAEAAAFDDYRSRHGRAHPLEGEK